MELTLRAFVTSGVALTAASAIVLAPGANAQPGTSGTRTSGTGSDPATHPGGLPLPETCLKNTLRPQTYIEDAERTAA